MARKTQKPLLGFRATPDELEKMHLFRKATGRSMSNILRRVWVIAQLTDVSDLTLEKPTAEQQGPPGQADLS